MATILVPALLQALATFEPSATLPPLLTATTTAATWPARRAQLKSLVEQHILGALPDGPPPVLLNATILNASHAPSLCGADWTHVAEGKPVQASIPFHTSSMPK